MYNCDWFSFTADFDNYDRELNFRLHQMFVILDFERVKPNEDRFVDFGLFKFEVLNHGSRSYYYILHNEDMQIKIAQFRSRSATSFPIYVHFKSQFLWSSLYGVSSLMDKFLLVIEWLEEVLGCGYIGSKISRLDLCYHTDDVPEDFNADDFVGRHTSDDTRRSHRRLSGVNIGSRKSQKIYLRCYDKYLESRATKKQWFFDIWFNAGMNIRKIWNIEFQLDREYFDEIKIAGKKIDSAESTIKGMASIWFYLTNDWITYRIPDKDRRTRWQISPWWIQLSVFNGDTGHLLIRHKQKNLPVLDALAPGFVGYLSAIAARTDSELLDGSLLQRVYKLIEDYENKNGKDFEKMVLKKKQLLDPEQKKDDESSEE